jgi:putative oxidoreductase
MGMADDAARCIGLLALRAVVGGLFVAHGAQKLFGAFGGHGPQATAQAFDQMGLRPGQVSARAAGAAELGGGALLAAGLLTPVGAAATSASMVGAIGTVHGARGPWNENGGYEYNLVLIAVGLTLTLTGPGCLSLDRLLGIERKGLRWAAAELAAAVGGGLGALAAGRALSGRATEDGPPPSPST